MPALTDLDTAGLFAAYAAPRERWVRCNMVTSLDGAATGADGRSGSINNDADHVVFEVLRALSHVVVVGRGHDPCRGLFPTRPWTIRSSSSGVEHGLPDELPLVAVSNRGRRARRP